MSDKNMVQGMHIDLSSKPFKCQHCILRKQTQNSAPRLHEGGKASSGLDIVYIDLTGPHVLLVSGNSYAMNLIDNATSMIWTIPLHLKSSAVTRLKEWVLHVEWETSKMVDIFRVDNSELKSTEYMEFCLS